MLYRHPDFDWNQNIVNICRCVNQVRGNLLFFKTSYCQGKLIAYLRPPMIGDANGVLFISEAQILKKLQFFFFPFLLPFSLVWKKHVTKIKCSGLPVEWYQICWVFYKSLEIVAISKKCAKLLRIDFSIKDFHKSSFRTMIREEAE